MSEAALEPMVVVGRMPQMGRIETTSGQDVYFTDMSWRSRWSLIRLQMGRTRADEEIKNQIDFYKSDYGWNQERARKQTLKDCMSQIIREHQDQREIQFILVGDLLKAVATTDHLLLPPEEVLRIARSIDPELVRKPNFEGVTKLLEDTGTLQLGFQLDPGNILTRRAIRIGYNIRVMHCFNPLSTIGVGHLNRFKAGVDMGLEKILRIKRKIELEERIREAVEGCEAGRTKLHDMIDNSKKVKVTPEQAKILLTAFPHAFGIGKKVIKQIVLRYAFAEEKTLWGLAQAASFIARNGEFAANARRMDQNLATAGAAYLGITDVDETASIARNWLVNVKKLDLSKWM